MRVILLLVLAGSSLLWGIDIVKAETVFGEFNFGEAPRKKCDFIEAPSQFAGFGMQDIDDFTRFPLAAAVEEEAPQEPSESDDELLEKYKDEVKEAQEAMARLLTTASNGSAGQNYQMDTLDGAAQFLLDTAESESSNPNGVVRFAEMKHLMGRLNLGNLITRGVWTSTMMDIFNEENVGRSDSNKVMELQHFRAGLIKVGFFTTNGTKTNSDVWNY